MYLLNVPCFKGDANIYLLFISANSKTKKTVKNIALFCNYTENLIIANELFYEPVKTTPKSPRSDIEHDANHNYISKVRVQFSPTGIVFNN